MGKEAKIRLFITQTPTSKSSLDLTEEQSHYLINVMKCKIGDNIICCDNKNGEFLLKISSISKKQVSLSLQKKLRDFSPSPDLWLIFAPLKKDKTDFVIEKATELGVRKIIPTITEYTITNKIRKDRFVAQSIEAAEQSRRLDLPEIEDICPLHKLLENWDTSRTLYFMDETLNGTNPCETFAKKEHKAAVLCGPEGGFSDEEAKLLRSKSFVKSVNLGPRILRAETAVVAALTCWQALCGDWNIGDKK